MKLGWNNHKPVRDKFHQVSPTWLPRIPNHFRSPYLLNIYMKSTSPLWPQMLLRKLSPKFESRWSVWVLNTYRGVIIKTGPPISRLSIHPSWTSLAKFGVYNPNLEINLAFKITTPELYNNNQCFYPSRPSPDLPSLSVGVVNIHPTTVRLETEKNSVVFKRYYSKAYFFYALDPLRSLATWLLVGWRPA